MTFRWLIVGWTGFALLGGLFWADIWREREASCQEETSLICFDERDVWVITGAVTGAIWFVGVLLLTVAALFAHAKNERDGR